MNDSQSACAINELQDVKLLGICGREGAGKTTITNILTGQNGPLYEVRKINDRLPLDYIIDIIFGEDALMVNDRDPIWNLTRLDQYKLMIKLITNYVDSNWLAKYNYASFTAPIDIPASSGCDASSGHDASTRTSNWVEFSFATALKKVCAVLFHVPYDILLAQTEAARVARETIHYCKDFDMIPPMNGRVILEYFGTDVMRNNFDPAIWIKIVERDSAFAIKQGNSVVFPDVRFENEIDMINRLDGALLVVYRNDEDLILTDDDLKTHPAKWNFLRYYANAKKLLKFKNNVLISDLAAIFSTF